MRMWSGGKATQVLDSTLGGAQWPESRPRPLRGPQSQSGYCGDNNFLPLPGIELGFLGHYLAARCSTD